MPAADAQALGDGTWTVNVSGKDAAGNTVSGSQTIGVDTNAPALSVDTIAQDNVINAAEHNQALTLTGKTDAEAGQIVTVTLNGKIIPPRWGATARGPLRCPPARCNCWRMATIR